MLSKKEVCNLVDLTSLNATDSENGIKQFLDRAIELEKKGFPVAAVCLFPHFSSLAVEMLQSSSIKVAVVAGGFPFPQGFSDLRIKECEKALKNGVDEIDVVLNLGAFMEGNHQKVVEEIKTYKELLPPEKKLKVILETGCLKIEERIMEAARLAIEGGADFIKTSTGKEYPGASSTAVESMIKVINETRVYEDKIVGLKVSGGVRTYNSALEYIAIAEKIMGEEYIAKDTFRIGASSLVTNLIDE